MYLTAGQFIENYKGYEIRVHAPGYRDERGFQASYGISPSFETISFSSVELARQYIDVRTSQDVSSDISIPADSFLRGSEEAEQPSAITEKITRNTEEITRKIVSDTGIIILMIIALITTLFLLRGKK